MWLEVLEMANKSPKKREQKKKKADKKTVVPNLRHLQRTKQKNSNDLPA